MGGGGSKPDPKPDPKPVRYRAKRAPVHVVDDDDDDPAARAPVDVVVDDDDSGAASGTMPVAEMYQILPVPQDTLTPLGPRGRAHESGKRPWGPEGREEYPSLDTELTQPVVWESMTRFKSADNQWDRYTPEVSQEIEAAHAAGKDSVVVTIKDKTFKIDLEAMTQTNTHREDRVRTVRRVQQCFKEAWIAAHFDFTEYSAFSPSANDTIEHGLGRRTVCGPAGDKSYCYSVRSAGRTYFIDKLKQRQFSSEAATRWRFLVRLPRPIADAVLPLGDDIARGDIPADSALFKRIEGIFEDTKWGTRARTKKYVSHSDVKVARISFVVNRRVYLQFMHKLQTYGEDARCMLGFHGTTNRAAEAIATDNFSLNKIGASTGNLGWFGKGIYFGRRAFTALGYCQGDRLLASVVVTRRTFQVPAPDSRDNPYHGKECEDGYDSHLSPTGRELVIFNPRQIIPCFMIHLSSDKFGMDARGDYYGLTVSAV